MRYLFLVLYSAFFFSCNMREEDNTSILEDDYFYIGTYTNGESEGIYKFKLSAEGILDSIGLVAKSDNPSFLAFSKDKRYLIACNEINTVEKNGTVESFKVLENNLELITTSSSGGAHPCFVNIDEEGTVLVTNYTGGNVGLLKLNKDGGLSELLDVQQHIGRIINNRQYNAHAHSAWFIPNSNKIISVDLGTNELLFSEISDNKSIISPITNKLLMEEGAGPRHLSIHSKGWIYVVNELNSTVSLVVKNVDGIYKIKNSISTLPDNFKGESYCADIHISYDEKFLYASNRGDNSIVVFSINKTNGMLTTVSIHSVKGNWPRNFSLSPNGKFLLVANQKSNNITSFLRDEITGKLTFVDKINAPTPVCLLFE